MRREGPGKLNVLVPCAVRSSWVLWQFCNIRLDASFLVQSLHAHTVIFVRVGSVAAAGGITGFGAVAFAGGVDEEMETVSLSSHLLAQGGNGLVSSLFQ